MRLSVLAAFLALVLTAPALETARAAEPARGEGAYLIRDFRFGSGETLTQMKFAGARFHIIPASPETRGHGTTGNARLWTGELAAFLAGN